MNEGQNSILYPCRLLVCVKFLYVTPPMEFLRRYERSSNLKKYVWTHLTVVEVGPELHRQAQ